MLKLLGNSIMLSVSVALSKAQMVAEKCGLRTDILHGFIESLMPAFLEFSQRIVNGESKPSLSP